jgi:nicotinamidase-related amidase
MSEYTLVVVDMQSDFRAANDPATIAAVEKEILEAVRLHQSVVVLEIAYFSPLDEQGLKPTHRSLMSHLKGYDRVAVRQKIYSDGSRHVLNTCSEQGYSRSRFRVCGVNTDACVVETAVGLAKAEPTSTVEVLQGACNTTSQTVDWQKFLVEPNVRLLAECNSPV